MTFQAEGHFYMKNAVTYHPTYHPKLNITHVGTMYFVESVAQLRISFSVSVQITFV